MGAASFSLDGALTGKCLAVALLPLPRSPFTLHRLISYTRQGIYNQTTGRVPTINITVPRGSDRGHKHGREQPFHLMIGQRASPVRTAQFVKCIEQEHQQQNKGQTAYERKTEKSLWATVTDPATLTTEAEPLSSLSLGHVRQCRDRNVARLLPQQVSSSS